jgi:hypothetical protein
MLLLLFDREAGLLQVLNGDLLHGLHGIQEGALLLSLGSLGELVVVGVEGHVDVGAVGEGAHVLCGVTYYVIEVGLVGEELGGLP